MESSSPTFQGRVTSPSQSRFLLPPADGDFSGVSRYQFQSLDPLSSSQLIAMESSSPTFQGRVTSPSAAVSGKTCPICLRHVDPRRASVIAGCMHAYCHSCLLRWTAYKRRCPLCNAEFRSYFSNHNQISSRTFRKLHLPPPRNPPCLNPPPSSSSRTFSSIFSAAITTPRRRSFGRDFDRIRWRGSIYRQRLRAVPGRNTAYFKRTGRSLSTETKESITRRIEPWIRRELRALLNDPDPTLLVAVASELFVRAIDRSNFSSSAQIPDF